MPDNTAQIVQVTSESLQAQIRRLLPSQQGFGHDLQATNVIIPTIDLTSTAEGSILPAQLQNAWDFSTGHSTVANTTTNLIVNAGFWKVDLVYTGNVSGTSTFNAFINLSDGLTSKVIWELNAPNTGTGAFGAIGEQEFYVYLRSGDSLSATSNSTQAVLDISYRNVADVNGNLVNPLGFVSQ